MKHDLEEAIATFTQNLSLNDLAKARDSLTNKYRDANRHGKAKQFMISDLERLSYLVTRLPATYSVVSDVLQAVKSRLPNLTITSMLDLGVGPGTAFFAASDFFDEMQQADLIEQDPELIRLGKQLQSKRENKNQVVNWSVGNIAKLENLDKYDLVTISYAVNELEKEDRKTLLQKAFDATKKILIIMEPGSREGFSLIKEARNQLIELGGIPIAPCPHAFDCPMPENDWCHFSSRVQRSSAHRFLKQGSLGHEDEKFSYIAISKPESHFPEARIVRHPEKHSGHLKLTLCTKEGHLKEQTISKKDGDLYKKARKLEWGDVLSTQ